MSDDEVDELLKAVDTSSGEINYTGMSEPRMDYVWLIASTNSLPQILSVLSSPTDTPI